MNWYIDAVILNVAICGKLKNMVEIYCAKYKVLKIYFTQYFWGHVKAINYKNIY